MIQNDYADFDVPQNLKFKTLDIIRMGGLQCSAQIAPDNFAGVLQAPNKIIRATVELSFSVANKDIIVHGTLRGEREVECAR